MKTGKLCLLLFVLAIFSIYSFGQETEGQQSPEIKTLFKSEKGAGGYGGITARYTEIDKNTGIVLGARGCFVAGHSLAVGLAGNALIGEKVFNERLNQDCYYSGGYGGLLIEPIILPKYPIHISVPIVMGMGEIGYKAKNTDDDWGIFDEKWNGEDSKSFFIVEPGIELEINVLKFFRIAMGGYYRITNDINLKYDGGNDPIAKPGFLRGWSAGVTLKLGKF
jgi:hypothetical protein